MTLGMFESNRLHDKITRYVKGANAERLRKVVNHLHEGRPADAANIMQQVTANGAVAQAVQVELDIELAEAGAIQRVARTKSEPEPEPEPARTKTKPKKDPQPCLCGCGETTGGGRFRPGHDAKLKGQLLRQMRDGSKTADYRLRAIASLEEMGWGRFVRDEDRVALQ